MVKPFQFAATPQLIFRPGAISDIMHVIKSYGNNVVIVTGKDSFLKSISAKKMLDDLESNKISSHIISVNSEPAPELIDESVSSLGSINPDVIIGIGGGSVLDAGKAISAMTGMKVSVFDFLEGVGTKQHPGTKVPYIAVPTTSGTGSEATKNAVLSRTGAGGFKRSLRHDNFVPDIAIIDPELTISCSKSVTAASGMDCFTQLTESFLSEKSSSFTDTLAIEGLKSIAVSLRECCYNGDNIEARSSMSYAAYLSGICLANAGLGVVHGFASSVGGRYPVPHGVVCGTLMAAANEVNVAALRKTANKMALEKYARLGRIFSKDNNRNDEYYVDSFIAYIRDLTDELELPRLGMYSLQQEDIGEICMVTDQKNNPVKLSADDLAEILEKRI